jgi:signal transduction histidine kinase
MPFDSEDILRTEGARSGMARLLAVAGHDLKQPLQVALISIERAVLDGVEPRAAERLAHAIDALQRLGRELDELARWALTGGPSLRIQTAPLAPLLAQAQAEWQVHADHRGVQLRVRPTSALTPSKGAPRDKNFLLTGGSWRACMWRVRQCHCTSSCGRTDAAMLATVLRNLVGNAIRYARPGGRVVLGCRRLGGNIVLEVHDNGPGIAPERLDSVFDAGSRGGRRDNTGLGLGLYIVRETARTLGHHVGVRSRIGRGLTFGVTLRSAGRVPAPVSEEPDTLDDRLRQKTASQRTRAQFRAA